MFDQLGSDVVRQLSRGFRLPFRQDSFRVKWRELLLDLVRELEIQRIFASGMAFTKDGNGLARIVIAVVKKEDDLAADFLLQPSRAGDFGVEKSFRKKSARLLAETDDRRTHDRAKNRALKNGSEQEDGGAADEIVPEIADVQREERDEHERLRQKRSEENRRASHIAQEKRGEKKPEDAAVKNRAENVASLDQVLDQVGEGSDSNRDQTPGCGQQLRRDNVMMIALVRPEKRPVKIDRGCGTERVQGTGRGRHRCAKNHGHE